MSINMINIMKGAHVKTVQGINLHLSDNAGISILYVFCVR